MKKFFGINSYLIILAGTMLFIVLTIASQLASRDQDSETTPSPTITAPTPATPVKTNPPIRYEPTTTQKMLDRLSDPQQISQSDQNAKNKILSFLPTGQVSGVVYRSPTVIIDYVSSADQIQVEVLSIDVSSAKADAVAWLTSQGLSQNGICSLPVVFYLNRSVANDLENLEISFNPLAEGC